MRIGNRETFPKKSNQLFYIVDWLPPDFSVTSLLWRSAATKYPFGPQVN
jgi:hypothetical protein